LTPDPIRLRPTPDEGGVGNGSNPTRLVSEADFVAVRSIRARRRYRCPHGHTSATQLGLQRTRKLYVREDHVLRDLSATFGYPGRPDELVDYLRAEGITVICPPGRPTATSE
jgi:hypothetical protein